MSYVHACMYECKYRIYARVCKIINKLLNKKERCKRNKQLQNHTRSLYSNNMLYIMKCFFKDTTNKWSTEMLSNHVHTVDGSEILHHPTCMNCPANSGINLPYQLACNHLKPANLHPRVCDLKRAGRISIDDFLGGSKDSKTFRRNASKTTCSLIFTRGEGPNYYNYI